MHELYKEGLPEHYLPPPGPFIYLQNRAWTFNRIPIHASIKNLDFYIIHSIRFTIWIICMTWEKLSMCQVIPNNCSLMHLCVHKYYCTVLYILEEPLTCQDWTRLELHLRSACKYATLPPLINMQNCTVDEPHFWLKCLMHRWINWIKTRWSTKHTYRNERRTAMKTIRFHGYEKSNQESRTHRFASTSFESFYPRLRTVSAVYSTLAFSVKKTLCANSVYHCGAIM